MADLVVSSGTTAFMCTIYIVLGLLSMACNCLNLAIWLTSRDLRRKYIYLIALDMGELVNAISYVLVGSGRGIALIKGYLSTPITVRECFFTRFWPHSLILGTELPSFAMILISCERLCAALRPGYYNRIFMGSFKIILLVMVPVLGTVSVMIGGLSTLGAAGDKVIKSQHCAIINSTAIWYSTFHFIFIVLAYAVSFVSLFIVYRVSKKYKKGKIGGDNRLGVMLAIAGSSTVLVGSESTVMMLIRWNIATFSDLVVALTYSMPACISIFNTLINLILRPEFQRQFFVLFHIRLSSERIEKLSHISRNPSTFVRFTQVIGPIPSKTPAMRNIHNSLTYAT